jgi:hypothetical protein
LLHLRPLGKRESILYVDAQIANGALECFEACSDAWGSYIKGSLRSLTATGKGQPNVKES